MYIEGNKDGDFYILTMQAEGKFHHDMLAEFHTALDAAQSDYSVSGLVITGTDKNFSQGFDLERLGKLPGEEFLSFVERSMTVVARLLSFPIPAIAAVNGHAFGLGAMVALACDYRVMREDRGFFCLPEVDLGMTLIDSMNALVSAKLGGRMLRDALLTGKRYSGPELVAERVFDATADLDSLLDTACRVAGPMLGKQRDTLAGLKMALHAPLINSIHASVPPHLNR